jgi:hypothetical protein
MKKSELTAAILAEKTETKNALQTMYDALNQGQQKKIIKDEAVKALFDRYGVEYSE